MNQQKSLIPVCITAIITLAFFIYFSLPFKHAGFFPTMDDVQVVRIDQMLTELKSGQFPVRYIDNFGNRGGYMLFNYYSPLPYYIGAGYQLIVHRPVKATKLIFLTGITIGALGIFFLLKKYTGTIPALLGVCLFLSSAYVGYDVYVRGALAELWGLAFFPWVFWSFFKVRDKPIFLHCVLAAIFLALAILSHIAITFVFTFFLLCMVFIPPYKKESIVGIGLSLGLGLLLSAFFWLPLVLEKQYIIYDQSGYATNQYLAGFLSMFQLIGFDKINHDFPTFGLGLLIATLGSVVYLFTRKAFIYRKEFIYFLAIFVVSLLFTISVSKFIWDHIPQIRYLQSPWRFLSISIVCAIFICGLALSQIKKFWIQIIIVGLVLMYAIILQNSYLRPYTYNDIPEYKAEGVCSTTTWENEYLPKWVKQCIPKELANKTYPIFQTTSTISETSVKKNGREIDLQTIGKGRISVVKYYFPNWHLFIDGKKSTIYPSTKYGLITFDVPEGNHQVQLVILSTPAQKIGNGLSLIGLGLIGIILVLSLI